MKITVKASTMVKPTTATPTTPVWISNLDIIMPENFHVSTVYFYRSTDDGAADFFDPAALKAAPGRTLVEFYPMAGRLNEGADGRIEIKCSGEGAMFVEAESDGEMGDIADYTPNPRPATGLVPKADYSQGVSSFPLLLVQMTRFRCGGVSLGFAIEHRTVDGFSATHFIGSWAEIARGGEVSVKPFFDRRLLAARNPPSPCFPHVEYLPPPQLLENPEGSNDSDSEMMFSTFKLTRHQLDSLKAKCQGDDETSVRYTTYETLAGHVWRCVSKARGLSEHQETKLFIPFDGRSRLRPPLPSGYFGNVVFKATTVALCGELESNPLEFAVRRVHEAIARMDDEYMRSAIDRLEVWCEVEPPIHGPASYKCPNLGVVSWTRFGFYEVDFGWGSPANLGFAGAPPEGDTFVLPSPNGDGSLLYAIVLPKEQMMAFQTLLYQI